MASFIKPTAFTQFEFPKSIRLTPNICQSILIEFMKQILKIKEQIPNNYDKLNIESKKGAKHLKLMQLNKALNECKNSILNICKYHYENDKSKDKEDGIVWIDILLLFGKNYLSPLETYSLRFYIDAWNDDEKEIINDKTMQKIRKIIGFQLQQIDDIWDHNLPITECRICVNINNDASSQYFNDPQFLIKHD